MDEKDAIYFAALMEDYLQVPGFICELIENKLVESKFGEVIKFIIQRRRELEEKHGKTKKSNEE